MVTSHSSNPCDYDSHTLVQAKSKHRDYQDQSQETICDTQMFSVVDIPLRLNSEDIHYPTPRTYIVQKTVEMTHNNENAHGPSEWLA